MPIWGYLILIASFLTPGCLLVLLIEINLATLDHEILLLRRLLSEILRALPIPELLERNRGLLVPLAHDS